jgi:hypothetical protein
MFDIEIMTRVPMGSYETDAPSASGRAGSPDNDRYARGTYWQKQYGDAIIIITKNNVVSPARR